MTNVQLIYWVKSYNGKYELTFDKKGKINPVSLDQDLFGDRKPKKGDYYCAEEHKVIFSEDFDPNGAYRVIS